MTWTRRSVLVAGAGLAATACGHTSTAPAPVAPPSGPIIGGVTRLDPALDALIAADAMVEQLGAGIKWAEGPVWVRNGGYLLFSDVPGNTMHRWSAKGGVEDFMTPSGKPGVDPQLREAGSNGLAIDATGALIMCDSGDRALARVNLRTKEKVIFLDQINGKRFNSPNDLAIARSGAIYFTDPPYGLAGIEKSPIKELAFSGVFRRDPSGAVTVIDDSMLYPNGVALSPDETTLYVSNTDAKLPIIRAYSLDANGAASNPRTFFDAKPLMAPGVPGLPDGMKVDAAGNLFASGPGGILVIRADGKHLGTIGAGRAIANCGFGEDGRTLFLTASDSLARVRTLTTGWTA